MSTSASEPSPPPAAEPAPPPTPSLLESLVIPPGAPALHTILPSDILGFIRAYPQATETRGYIRRHLSTIMPPAVQAELGSADNILRWMLHHWCRINMAPGGAPVAPYVCSGQCFRVVTEGRCTAYDPTPGRPGYHCNRPAGHSGEHVACGSHPHTGVFTHNLYRWPNPERPAGVVATPPPAAAPTVTVTEYMPLEIEVVERVRGTFVRYDTYSGTLQIPMHVARAGVDEIQEYIRAHYEDVECTRGEDDLDTDDHAIDEVTTNTADIIDAMGVYGIDVDAE